MAKKPLKFSPKKKGKAPAKARTNLKPKEVEEEVEDIEEDEDLIEEGDDDLNLDDTDEDDDDLDLGDDEDDDDDLSLDDDDEESEDDDDDLSLDEEESEDNEAQDSDDNPDSENTDIEPDLDDDTEALEEEIPDDLAPLEKPTTAGKRLCACSECNVEYYLLKELENREALCVKCNKVFVVQFSENHDLDTVPEEELESIGARKGGNSEPNTISIDYSKDKPAEEVDDFEFDK